MFDKSSVKCYEFMWILKNTEKKMKILDTKRVYDGYLKVDVLKTKKTNWEIARAKPAVALFLFNKSNNCALFVRQCRPSMISPENPFGILIEAVAGRLDKPGFTIEQVASAEAHEEAGAIIPPRRITRLNEGKPLSSSAGMTDELIYLTYGEITNNDFDKRKKVLGAEGEGEEILGIQYVPITQLENQAWDNMHTALLVEMFLRMQRNQAKGGR